MKKIVLMIMLLFSSCLLGACSKEHNHTFSDSWSHNDISHWHEATCEHTTIKDSFEAHTWVIGEVTVEPTCQTKGKQSYTCVCGATKEEEIDVVGHDYSEKFETDTTHHWHNCNNCEAVEMEEHSWTMGEVTLQPGCETKGKQAYTCVCGTIKEEEIDAVGHDYSEQFETDATHHWNKCNNCEVAVKEEHSGGTATFQKLAECSICEVEYGEKLVLNPATNINYVDGTLDFDGADLATEYKIVIMKNSEVVITEIITETQLNLANYNLAGSYTVEIYSHSGEYVLETPATYTFTILSKVDDVVLEAELGLQAYANMYKGNELAHGGAYVGSIDNCGQGVTLDYFCYISGEYTLEAYYMTDAVGSYHNVYVNGNKQTRLDYGEKTGWGSDTKINTAKAVTTITLEKGWNRILVIKDGTEQDNWGAWAELDYFVVKGIDATYNIDDYSEYDLVAPNTYRLEGEQASFINRVDSKWGFSNLVPFYSENASSKYMIGGIDAIGQGLEWHICANKSGKYRVTVVYAYDVWDGGNYDVKLSFYHSTTHLRGVTMTGEVLQQYKVTDLQIDANWNGWGIPLVNSQTFEIDLVEGDNFIYLTKELQDVYCQIDYIELTEIIE